MRSPLIMLCLGLAALVTSQGRAAAAAQCLSQTEIGNAARMASIMAVGVAVQRCSRCLGPDAYAQTVKTYEAARLMDDFWKAKEAFDAATLIRLEDTVRDQARHFAGTLSDDCDACRKTQEIVSGLSSADARDRFYGSETGAIAGAPGVEACP